jgi:hypothetical protein
MRLSKLILLIMMTIIAWMLSFSAQAQSDLYISKVFDAYGKKKGVVMVDLSGEILNEYRLSLFKSITIKNDPAAADFTRKCLARDETDAKKIKQVVSNGIPTSIYLQLPRIGKDNRLILFNESFKPEQRITLIYIESKDDSESILNLLLKKKQ